MSYKTLNFNHQIQNRRFKIDNVDLNRARSKPETLEDVLRATDPDYDYDSDRGFGLGDDDDDEEEDFEDYSSSEEDEDEYISGEDQDDDYEDDSEQLNKNNFWSMISISERNVSGN